MASQSIVAHGETVRVSGVSLLFCDLVGSTALLAELGEEVNDQVRRDLFEALRQPVIAFHGSEVKSQGDGLMVAFRASADDAFGCAVAMQQAVVRLSAGEGCPTLAIRVGISAGEVTSEDSDWFGTPVVEAARLCGLAQSGQILVTDHTLRLSRAAWPNEVRTVGSLTLKGFPNPVACSELAWTPTTDGGWSAPVPPVFDLCGQPPAVGISADLVRVRRAWSDVATGVAKAVVVTGPPRSGKTRFVAELLNEIGGDAAADERSHLLSMTMSPAAASVSTAIGESFRRLVMWGTSELIEDVAETSGLDPTSVYAAAIQRLARDAPVVIVVEDVQRATVAVAEMLVTLLAAVADDRVLFVFTYRDSGDDPNATIVTLARALDDAGALRVFLGPLEARDVGFLVESSDRGDLATASTAAIILGAVGGVAGDVVDAVVRLRAIEDGDDDVAVRRALSPCVPYKGLLSLGEADEGVFFGRRELVEQVAERLTGTHFVALVGASGSGKSSVLRAGVANVLRSHGRSLTVVTPSDRDVVRAAAAGTISVDTLIIDQFEEFFTLWDEKDRNTVIEGLFSALSFGPLESIAIGIRSDFFGQCADHAGLVPRLADATVLVGVLDENELLAMIEGPAAAAGLNLDSGFAAMIVSDLGDERHPLPLLSHTLFETWRRRAQAGRLTVDDYHDAGGIRGSIARTAERVFTVQLDALQQRCARDLVLRLVEPGDQHRPATRRPVHRAVLADSFGQVGEDVIDVFVGARLLVADDDVIEFAHEAILNEWPRLAGWIIEDRERLITAAHLARSADEWFVKNRPQADLYRGSRLDRARELMASGWPLTTTEREFVAAGTELRDRERVELQRTNRRLRRQLAAASIAAVLAIGATVAAVAQQRTANRQRHQAQLALLPSTATALAGSRVDLAALLAVEANRLQPSASSLGALQTVLRTQPSVVRTLYPTFLQNGATLVATSTDSRMAAFATTDALTIVDIDTLQVRTTIVTDASNAVAFSPTGDRVAVAGDGHITTHSTVDGTTISTISLVDGEVVSLGRMAWIDDSQLFLTPVGGHSHVIDVTTGATTRAWDYTPTGLAVADSSAGGFVDFPTAILTSRWTSLTEHTRTGDVVYEVTNRTAAGVVELSGDAVLGADYSPDGRWMAVGTNQGLLLLRRDGATLIATSLAVQPPVPTTALFSPDGANLAAFAATGQVVIYDVSDPDSITERVHLNLGGGGAGIFSTANKSLYVVVGTRLLEVALDNREPLATATFGADGEVPQAVKSDGTEVMAATRLQSEMYDPRTGATIADDSISDTNTPWGYSADDSTRFAIDYDDETILLDDDQGRVKRRSSWSIDTFGFNLVSRDGTIMAAIDQQGTRLLLADMTTLELIPTEVTLATASGEPVLAITDDGALVARSFTSAADGSERVEVYDVRTGERVIPDVELPSGVGSFTALAFTPDGRTLSFGDDTGKIGNVDLSSGSVEREVFQGAAGSVLSLGYTADGEHLLGVLGSTSAVLWDTSSRSIVGIPITGTPSSFDISIRDSSFLWAISDLAMRHLVVSVDGGMRQWNIDFESWPDIACERAGRNLTRDEWDQYMPADDAYHQTCPQFAAA